MAFFRKLERIASTVVVACSTHIPEVRGSNPATDNEREIGRYKQIDRKRDRKKERQKEREIERKRDRKKERERERK